MKDTLQPDTYGKTPAAETLFREASKLSSSSRARISRFLINYRLLLKAVNKGDRDSAATLYRLIRQNAITAINQSAHFVPVASYMMNVIIGDYRQVMKEIES